MNKFDIIIRATSDETVPAASHFELSANSIKNNYKYFKVTKLYTEGNYTSDCKAFGWSTQQNDSILLNLNTEYEIYGANDGYKFGMIYSWTYGSTNGQQARCVAFVTFYNK